MISSAPLTTATRMLLFVLLTLISVATCSSRVPRASALMFRAVSGGNPTTVIGVIDFTESNGTVTIMGSVNGLPQGAHGFHVHEFGDLRNGCQAAGAHFNPLRSPHGGPANPPVLRHVGDLGNIMTPRSGPTLINIQDSFITFAGLRGIVGRAVVIHQNMDDLGTGGDLGSRTTGNAGARLACGIIGLIMPGNA